MNAWCEKIICGCHDETKHKQCGALVLQSEINLAPILAATSAIADTASNIKGSNEKGKDNLRERPGKRVRKREKETSEKIVPKKPNREQTSKLLPLEASP